MIKNKIKVHLGLPAGQKGSWASCNCSAATCSSHVAVTLSQQVQMAPLTKATQHSRVSALLSWVVFMIAAAGASARSLQILSLSGEWTLQNTNASITIPAIVPGVVHLDLLRAGIIPEPFIGLN